MPTSARRDLSVIGSICFLCAVAGWMLYSQLFRSAPAQDFMVFYTAAHSYIEGNLPLVFDGDAFTAKLNIEFSGWLPRPLELHPWVYPPLFQLMVIPLGIFPFKLSYVLFLGLSFVLLSIAICCYFRPGYQRWLAIVSLSLSPPSAFTIAVGQNSFLTTALLVAGFGLIPRTPVLAGALLGLLACKPQLWLLVPVALIASGEWKVLVSATATVCVFALASVVVLGVEPWREWLTLMLGPSTMYQHWLQFGRLNGQSAYTEVFLLGAPPAVASSCRALLLCAVLSWSGAVFDPIACGVTCSLPCCSLPPFLARPMSPTTMR